MRIILYVNIESVGLKAKSVGCMMMQSRYSNANVWDKVSAKLDLLTDRGPYVEFRFSECFFVIQIIPLRFIDKFYF